MKTWTIPLSNYGSEEVLAAAVAALPEAARKQVAAYEVKEHHTFGNRMIKVIQFTLDTERPADLIQQLTQCAAGLKAR